jgi:5'-nucleotidase
MKTKKFTILHSNDMHGDFLAELAQGGGKLIGGLALLSGYLNKVRAEEENVIYVISGDMVQGSLIDADYKGISTMEIMNFLAPDVVALGNHEFDYGLPHLLFLEKVANFPIVNANLYVKNYHRRLMRSHYILKKAGLEILFTGIITEKILDALKMDPLIGSIVSLEEASQEVGKICNSYKNDDIDLTILLTHIGLESDKELAKMLDAKWGVDMIIGGHSHSFMTEALNENGIIIAQAGNGTDQIGRFDIVVDDATNKIIDCKWHLIPINENFAEPDQKLAEFIESFKNEIDQKYSTVLTRFETELTHPVRETETTLGNCIADAFRDKAQCDVMLVGSGSIRVKSLGPVVTRKDFLACFPYDDSLSRHQITGRQLKTLFAHIMRRENRDGEGECYQVNHGVEAVYSDAAKELISLKVNQLDVQDDNLYTICIQGYHLSNSKSYLNLTELELTALGKSKTITTSAQEVLQTYFTDNQHLRSSIENRLVYKT